MSGPGEESGCGAPCPVKRASNPCPSGVSLRSRAPAVGAAHTWVRGAGLRRRGQKRRLGFFHSSGSELRSIRGQCQAKNHRSPQENGLAA